MATAAEVLPEIPFTPEIADYGWEQSAEVSEVMDAFAKAQLNFTDPVKDKQGQYGKHATMAGVYDSTRKHLNKEGIAVIVAKTAQHEVGMASVSVRLYKGGQFIGVHASSPIKAERQSYIWAQASAWTYLERYLTSGLTGVAPDDDDDGAAAAEGKPDQRDVQESAQQQRREQAPPAIAKEFPSAETRQEWACAFAECLNVGEWNRLILPMMKERGKEFIVAAAGEAKRRGYVGDRSTGKYCDPKEAQNV